MEITVIAAKDVTLENIKYIKLKISTKYAIDETNEIISYEHYLKSSKIE